MAAKPPLRHEEVQRVLRRLEPLTASRRIVLVGGQAVAFWMRFLQSRFDELAHVEPLTSKDIDFEGSSRSVRQAAELLAAKAQIAAIGDFTPNTGLVLFTDADGVEREIDFIEAPLGLTARDVRETAVRLEMPESDGGESAAVWVMHPERCMESRVVNATVLGKTDALALDQLRVSVICARLWSKVILDSADVPSEDRIRAVLRLNERIFRKCLTDKRFRDVVLDHDVQPFDAVLVDDTRLPEPVRATRYPQMKDQLESRLRRDRENRGRVARNRAQRASERKTRAAPPSGDRRRSSAKRTTRGNF